MSESLAIGAFSWSYTTRHNGKRSSFVCRHVFQLSGNVSHSFLDMQWLASGKSAKTRLDQNTNHREEQTFLLYLTSFCFCSTPSWFSVLLLLCSAEPWSDDDLVTHFLCFSLHFLPNLVSFHCFFYQLMLCHLRIMLQFSIYPTPIAHSSLADTYHHFLNFLTGLTSISVLSFSPYLSCSVCFSLNFILYIFLCHLSRCYIKC